ncbi:MAG: hypothetical protein P9M03_08695 [Candidatus Theseobacter exili]|nr:hypothetical protein [Candidatus Theseobacter exili]
MFKKIFFSVIFGFKITGVLEKSASYLANFFYQFGGIKVTSPVKMILEPFVHLFKDFFNYIIPDSPKLCAIVMLVFSLALLFLALYFLVKNMRSLVFKRIEVVFDKYICRRGIYAIIFGTVFTTFVQSSSVTTSLLVPMLGAGLITLENAFSITIGCKPGNYDNSSFGLHGRKC